MARVWAGEAESKKRPAEAGRRFTVCLPLRVEATRRGGDGGSRGSGLTAVFPKDTFGNAKRLGGERNAAIDGGVEQHFVDFVGCGTVVEGASQVAGQLVLTAQGGEHGEGDQAAGLEGEAFAAPHGAPGVFGDEGLQGPGKVGGACEGAVDEVVSHDLPADGEAAFKSVGHGTTPPG